MTESSLQKHSITLWGHKTSISLETPFWQELKKIAATKGVPLNKLIENIDEARSANLSSTIRVYILECLRK
ncbi:MAG: ribbon-helix-helix domain-containing protein [Alphaproteobacteria bacterium]|nr:ribbon-helix-helix domain-containing protein [Alphaproteobacteria bacterium]MBT5390364.1 ribbon-helix-helix domain-containing protein [Alphaproteobacteria bacterium]MBT5540229.1 ribbon-helix-helix domain-containing protein [Alphaproteobacteria bacterium]MBT5653912.1 ribbon-helix-helix domain-containing protein [Alphaproteobacteria bacterium]